MRFERRAGLLVTACALAVHAACSGPDTTCTCAVLNNTERRTIACGESACVGGNIFACTALDRAARQNTCTSQAAPPSGFDSGTPTTNPPPDHSCDDLAVFCSTSCSAPASVATDCQSTASSGDPGGCGAWQLSNGPLCHP